MHSLKNSVQLIGNTSSAVYVRTASNGVKQASLSMAINESYKNAAGERITETQRYTLVALGKIARLIENVSKGSKIAVEGKLYNRSFINKEGVKVNKTEIHVREVLILELNENTYNKIESDAGNGQGNDREI